MQGFGVTVIRIFLEVVLISLPYHLVFCLNECVVFASAFSLLEVIRQLI
jgi:hypothetical protein